MQIETAQSEVRSVFRGGSVGQIVSGLLWLTSAILGAFVSQWAGILFLGIGGMFIFPLTQLGLKLLGGRTSLAKDNPFNALAMQTAFIVPLCIPVIAGATLYNINWFYPAFMIVVGSHYLPFMTLYGMWEFGLLAAALLVGGFLIGWFLPQNFLLGGWLTALVLIVFGVVISLRYAKSKQESLA